jgi:hypothetical protein
MADYVEILDTQIEPDAPLTAVLAGQWRDNCIAIAEGADDSPVVSTTWHPYDATVNGASNGLIWSHAVSGNTATIETPVFAAGYEYRFAFVNFGGGDIQINLRRADTSAYNASSSQILFAGGFILRQSGYVTIEFPFVPRSLHKISGGDEPILLGLTASVAADRARLTTTSSNFVAGSVYLLRRRVEGL